MICDSIMQASNKKCQNVDIELLKNKKLYSRLCLKVQRERRWVDRKKEVKIKEGKQKTFLRIFRRAKRGRWVNYQSFPPFDKDNFDTKNKINNFSIPLKSVHLWTDIKVGQKWRLYPSKFLLSFSLNSQLPPILLHHSNFNSI